jgi:hypothetical protein
LIIEQRYRGFVAGGFDAQRNHEAAFERNIVRSDLLN